MTAQEVIETIKIAQTEIEWNYPMDYAIAFDAAIKALEKQIPMKPILKSGESVVHCSYADGTGGFEMNRWQDWVCPVCGWFVGQRYNRVRNGSVLHPHDQRKSDFCNECGQRIDWEGV
jgi:hypothetical protein